MANKTAFLTINSKDTSSGDHDCTVIAKQPLWIKELILSPSDNLGTPRGRVTPGNQPNGSLRTICVDTTNSGITTPAPFTLSVTYDDVTFVVSDVHVALPVTTAVANVIAPIAALLPDLNSEDQAMFVTQVLKAFSPPVSATNLGKQHKPYSS